MDKFPSEKDKDILAPINKIVAGIAFRRNLGRLAHEGVESLDNYRRRKEITSFHKQTKQQLLGSNQSKRPTDMPKVEYVDEDTLRARMAQQRERSRRLAEISEVYELTPASVESVFELIEENRVKGRKDSDAKRDMVSVELDDIKQQTPEHNVVRAEALFAIQALYDTQSEKFLV